MFRIALCDDSEEYLRLLESKIGSICRTLQKDVVINTFNDGDLLADSVEKDYIHDAYFLDVSLRDYSGLELADLIRERSKLAYIIFITADAGYAVEACGKGIFRYVLKETLDAELPGLLSDLFACLERMDNENFYTIQNQRRCLKFAHRDIVYIFRDQKNAVFVLNDGRELRERTTLDNVYRKLSHDKEIFLLDRGMILNLFHVRGVSNGTIKMDTGFETTSSVRHIEELKKQLNGYWGKAL